MKHRRSRLRRAGRGLTELGAERRGTEIQPTSDDEDGGVNALMDQDGRSAGPVGTGSKGGVVGGQGRARSRRVRAPCLCRGMKRPRLVAAEGALCPHAKVTVNAFWGPGADAPWARGHGRAGQTTQYVGRVWEATAWGSLHSWTWYWFGWVCRRVVIVGGTRGSWLAVDCRLNRVRACGGGSLRGPRGFAPGPRGVPAWALGVP